MTTATYNPLALTQPANSSTIEPLRILIYGKPKSRKTWWAGTASATHRVTLLDGENNSGILRLLPAEQQASIARIPLASKPNSAAFAAFTTAMFRHHRFLWSLDESRIIDKRHLNPSHDAMWFLDVDIYKLTTDDVIIIDSWTKLVADVTAQYAAENSVDIFAGERGKKTQKGGNDAIDYFRVMDIALDAILGAMQSMPCHLILVGHQQDYEVEHKTPLGTKKANRIQVISGSGKHSAKIPAFLSDVLWFETNDGGATTTIHCGSDALRDGGGANVPPEKHQFPGWEFSSLLAATNKPAASSPRNPSQSPAFTPLTGAQIRATLTPQPVTTQAATNTGAGIIGFNKR